MGVTEAPVVSHTTSIPRAKRGIFTVQMGILPRCRSIRRHTPTRSASPRPSWRPEDGRPSTPRDAHRSMGRQTGASVLGERPFQAAGDAVKASLDAEPVVIPDAPLILAAADLPLIVHVAGGTWRRLASRVPRAPSRSFYAARP